MQNEWGNEEYRLNINAASQKLLQIIIIFAALGVHPLGFNQILPFVSLGAKLGHLTIVDCINFGRGCDLTHSKQLKNVFFKKHF